MSFSTNLEKDYPLGSRQKTFEAYLKASKGSHKEAHLLMAKFYLGKNCKNLAISHYKRSSVSWDYSVILEPDGIYKKRGNAVVKFDREVALLLLMTDATLGDIKSKVEVSNLLRKGLLTSEDLKDLDLKVLRRLGMLNEDIKAYENCLTGGYYGKNYLAVHYVASKIPEIMRITCTKQ